MANSNKYSACLDLEVRVWKGEREVGEEGMGKKEEEGRGEESDDSFGDPFPP